MGKSAGADIFGASVKMALERGAAAGEREAFEGIVFDLVHGRGVPIAEKRPPIR